jgi:glucose-6-phosphate 1-dehydrogenase
LIPNQSQKTCKPALPVEKRLDSAMLDKATSDRQSGQGLQTTALLQCPPRRQAKPADPCAMVIFGATGDLTKRLLIPALYNLMRTNVLPENFALIGVARTSGTVDDWRNSLYGMLKSFIGNASAEFAVDHIDETVWKRLAEKMLYIQGDMTKPELYERLRGVLAEVEKTRGTEGNAIFYLAVADQFFGPVVEQLGRAKLASQDEDGNGKDRFWRRVVIEKPFGHSFDSARALNTKILQILNEDQIYRIDHFLGKDTVQSITAFRFANGIFEPLWTRDRIDHVQITAAETVGVEKRGRFYEATGALRDMVPNHVFSLLTMVAMEPLTGFDAATIRSRKAEVLAAMPAVTPQQVVRGQYGAGTVLGQPVKAYRDEPEVARDSDVETFVAMRLEIDNWRWAGVPIYIRTGKHLSARNTEIAICFKQAPYAAFQDTPVNTLRPNWLVLRIAPDEGISLQFEVKRPGPVVDLAAVKMDFRYDDWFPKERNVGYETLLYDVMIGDQTLFMRADIVEQGWRIVQPVLDAWTDLEVCGLPIYPSGSAGPAEAAQLLARDGRWWRPIDGPSARRPL